MGRKQEGSHLISTACQVHQHWKHRHFNNEDNTTHSVLITLLSLVARFAIKISLLSTDAGTNLLKKNLNPKLRTERTEQLFNMLSQCHTSIPRSQWTNYSESSTRHDKLYLKKAFNMSKDSIFPHLQRDEWKHHLLLSHSS